ncbi:MAG: presqualene diphosphate synthase HpnD [Alphaproteobacteria bacterium]
MVAGSGTSFFWGMRVLPRPKREAMFAIYAFCREVDDIADGSASPEKKVARLAAWREEIDRLYAGRPESLTTRALLGPVTAFGLAREDFLAIVAGMEMDASGRMKAPPMAELDLYCARVAGAVGLLAVRVFGADGPRARDIALALGYAFQLTNILRDLNEDAQLGRLYLPRELLTRHGIAAREPEAVLRDPGLAAVCRDLAGLARRRFDEAAAGITAWPGRTLRPAAIMMGVYRSLLARLEARGFERVDESVRVPRIEKLWIAFRHGVL